MLAIHNQRHSYRSDQPLTVWLYAIARYKLIDTLRARSAHGAVMVPFNDDDEDSAIAATPAPQAEETRRDLLVILQTLPDCYRLPIVHVKLQGLAVTHVADSAAVSQT